MMNYTFASATILLVLITDPVGNIPIFANALKTVASMEKPRLNCLYRRRNDEENSCLSRVL